MQPVEDDLLVDKATRIVIVEVREGRCSSAVLRAHTLLQVLFCQGSGTCLWGGKPWALCSCVGSCKFVVFVRAHTGMHLCTRTIALCSLCTCRAQP